MNVAKAIKQKAIELGFDLAGITDASPIDNEQVEVLADWLASNYAAQMDYMRSNFEKRVDPAKLLKNAQSVICLGLNYKPPNPKENPDMSGSIGIVTNYAQYEDYHIFIKKLLRQLVEFMITIVGESMHFKICVDSVPLAERALAVRAGLGFIGKNHMLVNPELGSQILLGEIITDLKLPIDKPIENKCIICNKCIEACPTSALRPDGRFDAGKCISYFTIEHRGDIPPEVAGKITNQIFGCDKCILACPAQKKAPVRKNKKFKFYSDRAEFDLKEILNLTEQDFETKFAGSPMERLGLERLKRNAKICLANIAKREG